jgi:hypothetical protein
MYSDVTAKHPKDFAFDKRYTLNWYFSYKLFPIIMIEKTTTIIMLITYVLCMLLLYKKEIKQILRKWFKK